MNCFKCKTDLNWVSFNYKIKIILSDFKKGDTELLEKAICKDCLKLEVLL